MTSDSDFMPLAMRIRQDGLPVYGFGPGKTPESFRQACTRFIDVGALMEAAKHPAPKDSSNPIDEELIGLSGAAIALNRGVMGKSVYGRVEIGGRRIIKK